MDMVLKHLGARTGLLEIRIDDSGAAEIPALMRWPLKRLSRITAPTASSKVSVSVANPFPAINSAAPMKKKAIDKVHSRRMKRILPIFSSLHEVV
ncbi:MAG: hypothetical protein V1714_03990 [Pseudomonadota bacterium]